VTPQLTPNGFVITVSTIQSRKNNDLLYRVWRRFAEDRRAVPRLVIVGQRGFGSADLLWQIEHDPLVRESISVLHHVSDGELAWLYGHCRFTLYPSLVEGWGLPVSESLAHGKLCVAANTSSLPEAGAGLALHLDPFDFRAWHDTILSLVGDPAKLTAAEQRIRAAYHRKTWPETAADLAAVLKRLMAAAAN
jgi:glycosyltransferase involved in cell wall biosynthesis